MELLFVVSDGTWMLNTWEDERLTLVGIGRSGRKRVFVLLKLTVVGGIGGSESGTPRKKLEPLGDIGRLQFIVADSRQAVELISFCSSESVQ